ncbi:MAG: hypothetical protein PHW74_07205 [Desulfobacca sp.]|nr:hypothetical protein [Desulfobacca sp.]
MTTRRAGIQCRGRMLDAAILGADLRPAPGNDKARGYDYLDINVGVLVNAARARVYGGQNVS